MSDQQHNLPPETDSYLWDGTGPIDADVKKFEDGLRPLAFKAKALPVVRRPIRRWAVPLTAAAVLLISAIVWKSWTPKSLPAIAPTWAVLEKTGSPTLSDPQPFKADKQTQRFANTNASSKLTLSTGKGTKFTLESRSAAQVIDGTDQWPWISLTQGSARVEVAREDKPVLIGVLGETATIRPGAVARVELTDNGAEVQPDQGEAWIDWKGVQTRVASPSMITIDSTSGPRLPSVFTKSKELFEAIYNFEQLSLKTADTKFLDAQLKELLNATTRREAMLVWNLLARVDPSQRRMVRDRLAKLIREPDGVDRDAVLKLEPNAMDAWWHASVTAATNK